MYYKNTLQTYIRLRDTVKLEDISIADHSDNNWLQGREEALQQLKKWQNFLKHEQIPSDVHINPPNGIMSIPPGEYIMLKKLVLLCPVSNEMIPLYGTSTDPDTVLSRLEKEHDLYRLFAQVNNSIQPVSMTTNKGTYDILPDSDPLLEPIKNAITITP